MAKLFKIEMKKLFKSTAMRVMLIVICVLSLLSVAVYNFAHYFADDVVSLILKMDGYHVLQALLSDNSDTMLFSVLLLTILIGGDFSARTLQSQISAGFGRFQIICSRLCSAIIIYAIFYIAYLVVSVGGMTITLGFGADVTLELIGEILLQMFMSFFMSVAMITIYMLFCFLVKSTGPAIGICLPIMMVGAPIISVITMVNDMAKAIIEYTPFGQLLLVTEEFDALGYVKFFAVGAVWMIAFVGITYATFKDAELK